MSDPHTASAIAQLVFYAPMVPCTLFFCVRNWKYRPRTAWYPPVPFALIRLIGAILVIVYKQDTSNLGVLIGAIVTLNVGLIPLILGFLGLTRVVTESSFKDHRALRITMKLIRHVIIIAASLLGTAGGFTGQPVQATLQSTLSRVAYLLFLAILVVLTGICVWIFLQRDQLKPGDRIYNRWIFIAIPFLFIRAAFGLASVFSASGNQILTSIWSPLFGSAVLFSLMALLPEYIVLVIYQYLAFHRWRAGKAEEEAKIAREHRRARRNHRSERDDSRSDRHLELGSDDA